MLLLWTAGYVFFFSSLEYFRRQKWFSFFFHGFKKMKWETTTLGYKYSVYKNWRLFWDFFFQNSFLIEISLRKQEKTEF